MAFPPVPGPDAFTVAIICPLKLEIDAARSILTKTYDIDSNTFKINYNIPLLSDTNIYYFGKVHQFNVVLCQPFDDRAGQYPASLAYHNLKGSFLKVKYLFLMGIAGGVPKSHNDPDIRLGDVVVGVRGKGHNGVTHIDGGWQLGSGLPEETTIIHAPDVDLERWAKEVKTKHETAESSHGSSFVQTAKSIRQNVPRDAGLALGLSWDNPGPGHDLLFPPKYKCESQEDTRLPKDWCPAYCDKNQCILDRPLREEGDKLYTIHTGLICSLDKVMMDSETRDDIADKVYKKRKHGVILCYEMEAYGIAQTVPILQVRGICDYSDSHKTKRWQPYAALQAAAVLRLILDSASTAHYQHKMTRQSFSTPSLRDGPIMGDQYADSEAGLGPLYTSKATEEPGEIGEGTYNELLRAQTTNPVTSSQTHMRSISHGKIRMATAPIHPRPTTGEKPQFRRAVHPQPISIPDVPANYTIVSPKSRRNTQSSQRRQSKSSARLPSISEPPEPIDLVLQVSDEEALLSPDQDEEYAEDVEHIEDIEEIKTDAISPSTDSNDRDMQTNMTPQASASAVVDAGQELPKFYATTEPFPRTNFVHDCTFEISVGRLVDDSDNNPAMVMVRHGEFEAKCTIQDFDIESSVKSKALSFLLKNNRVHLRFWVPVDGIVETITDSQDAEYLYRWSDCESFDTRKENGWPTPYHCYNARRPNIMLRIRFDNPEAGCSFSCLMTNRTLEGSWWKSLRDSLNKDILDHSGRKLKLYEREPPSGRRPAKTDTLIAAFEENPGHPTMKLYLVSDFNISAKLLTGQTLFTITNLQVLNYSTERLKAENKTRYQLKSVRGEPLLQGWGYFESDPFFRKKVAPCIVLDYPNFSEFLDMVLSWKLEYYTDHAKLQKPTGIFHSTTDVVVFFGSSKEISPKCHFLCYDPKASTERWHIFEVQGHNPRKNNKLPLNISRWGMAQYLATGQFDNLKTSNTNRTIEFTDDDECQTVCEMLQNLQIHRTNTRKSSSRSTG